MSKETTIVGAVKNIGSKLVEVNKASAFIVAKQKAGDLFNNAVIEFCIKYLPAPISAKIEQAMVQQFLKSMSGQAFASLLIIAMQSGKVKPSQTKWANMAIEALILSSVGGAVNLFDVKELAGQFLGKDFVDAVDEAVYEEEQENASTENKA